jgi:ComF family protein
MNQFLKNIKVWILEILYPVTELPADLPINQTLFCPVCRARQAEGKKICHKFAQYQLGAATTYNQEVIRAMIWRLKYRGKTAYAPILANLLIRYLESCNLNLKLYTIVPMPLSQKRLRERGYNQTSLIAKTVAENFGLIVEERALTRQRHTKPHMELKDWDERRKNILNCFGVANPALIKNKNIILIDDVFTSGATMSEAVHALKDFGAKKVIGLVVAKAG